jgi:hypothetical protein
MNDEPGRVYDTNFSAETPQYFIWVMRLTVRKNYWFDIQLSGQGKRKEFFIQHQALESIRECVMNKVP